MHLNIALDPLILAHVLVPALAKDLVVRQDELVRGIVGKCVEEYRDVNLCGDGRDLEGVCDVGCTVKATGMAWVPQERRRGQAYNSKTTGERWYGSWRGNSQGEEILTPPTAFKI